MPFVSGMIFAMVRPLSVTKICPCRDASRTNAPVFAWSSRIDTVFMCLGVTFIYRGISRLLVPVIDCIDTYDFENSKFGRKKRSKRQAPDMNNFDRADRPAHVNGQNHHDVRTPAPVFTAERAALGNDAERMIEFEFVRATENAALNVFRWLGRGEKEQADAAACDAIRGTFERLLMRGSVVIGEGIKDNTPGIFLGEKLGH